MSSKREPSSLRGSFTSGLPKRVSFQASDRKQSISEKQLSAESDEDDDIGDPYNAMLRHAMTKPEAELRAEPRSSLKDVVILDARELKRSSAIRRQLAERQTAPGVQNSELSLGMPTRLRIKDEG